MSRDRKFYVYEHIRPDRGEVFYVGKGRGKRAHVMYNRNGWHKAIQAKLTLLGLCVEIRIVAMGLTEDEAHALEIERIAFWRADGADLANLTAGGEGASDPAPETRAKMRAAKLGRTLEPEHRAKISASTKDALNAPGMHEKLSAAIKKAAARPEVKAKRSASQKARIRTKEHYDKVSQALTGRKLSPEHAEKSRKASLGRKQTPEEIERRRTANKGKKRDPEFCARMKAMWTPERKAKQALITAERNRRRANKVVIVELPLEEDK